MKLATGVLIDPAPLAVLGPIVSAAERLGFEYCYVSDQGAGDDIYVLLGALAVQTDRIRLGPGVTNPYTRHPAVTAAAIATLDELSGGRAFLGIGAGGARALDTLGVARAAPVESCTDLVSRARASWKRDIEVHWAARGPKMLATGARLADVMVLNGIAHRELASVVGAIHRAKRDRPDQPRIQYAAALVFDQPSRQGLRARTAFRLVDTPPSTRAKLGVSADLYEQLRETVRSLGPAAAAPLVDDRLLSEYVIDAGKDPVAQLRALVCEHEIGGLTVDVSDIPTAIPRLEAAADVFARL